MSPSAVIDSLIRAIPAEEGAAFVAQAGKPGRITSHGRSRDVGSALLTVAVIDELNATIFPPDRLQALQDTGFARHDFELPGVDGAFSALASATPGDRWLDIRRRRTAAAAPPPVAARPETPGQLTDPSDDLEDLRALEFPARAPDEDPHGFSMADDLFEGPRVAPGHRPPGAAAAPFVVAAGSHREPAFMRRARTRKGFRVMRTVVLFAAAVLLVALYLAATRLASAGDVATRPARATATVAPARANTPVPAPLAPRQNPAPTPAPPAGTSPTPAQPAPLPAAGVEGPSRGIFSVQVAAVRGREHANRMVTRFVTQGYPAYVVRGDGVAAEFYRVRIGDFPDRAAAEAVAQQLTVRDGMRPWIANGR